MMAVVEMLVEDAIQERDLAIAKNALKKGAEIDFIRDITGLNIETIKKLQAELNNE
jgi:predicted transposase YdaD